MRTLAHFIARDLWHDRLRSLLTVLSLAVVVVAFLLLASLAGVVGAPVLGAIDPGVYITVMFVASAAAVLGRRAWLGSACPERHRAQGSVRAGSSGGMPRRGTRPPAAARTP